MQDSAGHLKDSTGRMHLQRTNMRMMAWLSKEREHYRTPLRSLKPHAHTVAVRTCVVLPYCCAGSVRNSLSGSHERMCQRVSLRPAGYRQPKQIKSPTARVCVCVCVLWVCSCVTVRRLHVCAGKCWDSHSFDRRQGWRRLRRKRRPAVRNPQSSVMLPSPRSLPFLTRHLWTRRSAIIHASVRRHKPCFWSSWLRRGEGGGQSSPLGRSVLTAELPWSLGAGREGLTAASVQQQQRRQQRQGPCCGEKLQHSLID